MPAAHASPVIIEAIGLPFLIGLSLLGVAGAASWVWQSWHKELWPRWITLPVAVAVLLTMLWLSYRYITYALPGGSYLKLTRDEFEVVQGTHSCRGQWQDVGAIEPQASPFWTSDLRIQYYSGRVCSFEDIYGFGSSVWERAEILEQWRGSAREEE